MTNDRSAVANVVVVEVGVEVGVEVVVVVVVEVVVEVGVGVVVEVVVVVGVGVVVVVVVGVGVGVGAIRMTPLEHYRGLHLQDLRENCPRVLSQAFKDGLAAALEAGERALWVQARREAGKQHSEEVLKWEGERYEKVP